MLANVCALQGQYGKTVAELETLVEGFCWVLGGYPVDDIIAAIGQHIRQRRDIPKPADIELIINPPPPKLSASLYVSLQKKAREGGWLLSDERQFCRAYEQQEMATGRESVELAEAKRRIAIETRSLDAIGYEGEIE